MRPPQRRRRWHKTGNPQAFFHDAGSAITQEVPPDALAFGRAQQVNKEGRAAELRKAKAKT